SMSSKTTWLLMAMAAGLFAFIFFLERPFRQRHNEGPERKIFPDFKTNEVISIQIESAGQPELRVTRTNQTWQLTRPLIFPADRAKVESLLQILDQLQWQARISPEELKTRSNTAQEFGFDTPLFSVSLEQQNSSRHFSIGSRTPVGGQLFLQTADAGGYYLVDASFLNLFPKNANDWRDRTLVDLSRLKLNALKIRSGNKEFELKRSVTNSLWRMTKPLAARANNPKIETLLKKLQTVQIAQFVTDNPKSDLESIGLQTPELELIFGSQTNFSLQMGASPTNQPALVYARRQNQPFIFFIPKEPLAPWSGAIDDFRDRHLVNLLPQQIHQINIEGDDSFSLQRQINGHWTLNNTNSFSVDSTFVQELLLRLTRLEVEFEKAVVTDFSAYGLAPPQFQYTLQSFSNNASGANQVVLEQINFGANESGKIFVRRADESSVNFIKLEDYQYFPRASWQFRERRIWDFQSTNVVSATIRQKGQTRTLRHKSENEWLVVPGFQEYTNSFSMEETMHRLGELKAGFWIARDEKNRERFGFQEADHEISLQINKDGRRETLNLEFGGLSELRHPYAAVVLNGERMIFEFPWDLFYEFVRQDLIISPLK
ncbi:MAG: DUF4340 domain-containing protein, partial [Limisphaerales bacterium]